MTFFSTCPQQAQIWNSKPYSKRVSRVHITKKTDLVVYQTLQKNQIQDTIIKFIKIWVELLSENHTNQIMYVWLIADESTHITTKSQVN